MAKTLSTVIGIVFILVGIAGFLVPNLLGAHFTFAHNIIHLFSGAIALYFGLGGTHAGARAFCLVFGAVYLLLGVVGMVAGTGAGRMLTVIPDALMLGTMDHIIHILIGALFLIGGLTTKAAVARA
jgi:hypothetical protein